MGDPKKSLEQVVADADHTRQQELVAAVRLIRSQPSLKRLRTWARALSGRTRLVILSLLKTRGELSVKEIQMALQVSNPTVSQHMRILQKAGLVDNRRQGRWSYYKLDPQIEGLLPE
jgi:ArsR family transcriptional regulator